MDGVVKDVCPKVEDGGNNYFCSQHRSLPGYFKNSTSKAPCKLWRALSLKEDDGEVVLMCNDHHDVGEILRLPSKSFLTCTEDNIPLQDLENCDDEEILDSEITTQTKWVPFDHK